MKKILYFAILTFVFASCSSDGSREIQIDEVQFVPDYQEGKIEDYSKVSSIFEVVPGKYTISWRLVHDLPQAQHYNVELKLRLRLKKTVKVLPEVFEKMGNASYDGVNNNNVYCPFAFNLVNANGKTDNSGVQKLSIDWLPVEDWQGKGSYNKDQMMDFVNFLASKPGTEIEVVCNCLGIKTGAINCKDDIKNARGIQCVMMDEDEQFKIGTIVE